MCPTSIVLFFVKLLYEYFNILTQSINKNFSFGLSSIHTDLVILEQQTSHTSLKMYLFYICMQCEFQSHNQGSLVLILGEML